MLKRAPLGAALAAYLMISGCSSTKSSDKKPSSSALSGASSASAGSTSAASAIDPANSLSSVVRIVHDNGAFPTIWQVNQYLPLAGSGFVVDATGLVVTSSAITAGRDTVKVFVGTDPQPKVAKVIGHSVCDGLAVLSLPTPNPTFLLLSDSVAGGKATALGTSDTGGTVSVTGQLASGASAFANRTMSIKDVRTFDAKTEGATVGGPVIDRQGRVAGIVADSGVVIPAPLIRIVVDRFGKGQGREPGVTVVRMDDVNDLQRGVFVTSVERGSDADAVGTVKADVIRTVNGRNVETGTTIAPFCDGLAAGAGQVRMAGFNRSNAVLFDRLVGEGNVISAGKSTATIAPATGAELYSKFTEVTDASKLLRVKVPQGWSTVDERPSPVGPAVAATTNLPGFIDRWESPGLFFTATRKFGRSNDLQLLSLLSSRRAECLSSDGISAYSDNTYSGLYEILRDCGGTATDYVIISASPNDGDDYLVGVTAQMVTDRDWTALERAIQSFRVIGALPH